LSCGCFDQHLCMGLGRCPVVDPGMPMFSVVYPGSPENPKVPRRYDAKVIGHTIAKRAPPAGHIAAQETEHGVAKSIVSGITSVVGYVLVHQSPQTLDRVQMRAVGRNEMEPDPPAWPTSPEPPWRGVAGVVQKHMDDPHRRIQGLDRDQESDRAPGVDRQHLDHAGLAGFQIDGAVNVHALPAWSTATLMSLGAQQPTGRAPSVGCAASANINASSSGSVS
jgi:hypothetical protein